MMSRDTCVFSMYIIDTELHNLWFLILLIILKLGNNGAPVRMENLAPNEKVVISL